jgi:endonuclease/exonuclease/phosphatase family metal-dependent hydrolase
MTDIRIATFNVENLFTRARVLNKADFEATAGILSKIDELKTELAKKVYDKNAIATLYEDLRDYIDFNVTSSQGRKYVCIWHADTGTVEVDVNGRDDWNGHIVEKRAKFDDVTRKNTARVIKSLDADLLALVEVEDRQTMEDFDTDVLGNRYAGAFSIQGFDPRGIDVGFYFAKGWTVAGVATHIFEKEGRSRVFSRDCLELELVGPDGIRIHVLVNHFKSKSGSDQAGNDAKRLRQARRVAEILGRFDLARDLVVVLGDFNDTPASAPLAPLMNLAGLRDVFDAVDPPVPAAERWTYHYKTNEQIDFILVSDALAAHAKKVEVERRGIADLDRFTGGAQASYDTVTSWRNAASDHAGVVATFSF